MWIVYITICGLDKKYLSGNINAKNRAAVAMRQKMDLLYHPKTEECGELTQ